MLVRASRPVVPDRKKNHLVSVIKWLLIFFIFMCLVGALTLAYEMHTSWLQARKIARYAATLQYAVRPGATDKIVYPEKGPSDLRLGYAQLPTFLKQVQKAGMGIRAQATLSPALLNYARKGYFIPYPEKHQAGLQIIDRQGQTIYQARYPDRIYTSFDSIPPVVTQTLLFIENRELLDTARPHLNPAVDWVRLTRAMLHEVAKSAGMTVNRLGGSTLATQTEKFRHSPGGFTPHPSEKLRQMVSASVRAYQAGPNTLATRKNIVLTYLNAVPLAAAPGFGEVHGLGDALWVWFNTNFKEFNQVMRQPNPTGDLLMAQAKGLRQVIALLIAQRRPEYYLHQPTELNQLTSSYLRLLAQNNYISPALRDAGLAQEVRLRGVNQALPLTPVQTDKGTLMVRTHLAETLQTTLYDLDRVDLTAHITLQHDLQEKVSAYIHNLSNPAVADSVGILGKHLLTPAQTPEVRYSFTLLESTPQGNLIRVQTDNTDQPFDLNEHSKLELGSTAKLRVLVHYLQVVAEIHQKYAPQTEKNWRAALQKPQDNLTRWVLQTFIKTKKPSLEALLRAALERRYSASPKEVFFTGGGLHTFRNFQKSDNHTRPTVQEALLRSINLPFVRLMRDLVQYSIYQTVARPRELLNNEKDPRRRQYLTRFADREGNIYLRRFWKKYAGKSADARFNLLLKSMRLNPVRLAVVHRYLYPATDSVAFEKFLRQQLPTWRPAPKRIRELYHRYGPHAYSLPDQGYLAGVHPLELWFLRYRQQHPQATWNQVKQASQQERQEVYTWLFRTRFKHARDSRIKTMLELEGFKDIRQRWQKLGYPFNYLVPSYATALGSSGDRPAALADLMGIIVNQGIRRPNIRFQQLHFAAGTPYETIVGNRPAAGEAVIRPEVAHLVKDLLIGVVEKGTAIRLHEEFTRADGNYMRLGGKTGTGDNRLVTVNASGQRLTSRAVNRTATFVFFLGSRHFGTITAFVPGRAADDFSFTSTLPIQVLRGMAPMLEPYLTAQPDTVSLPAIASTVPRPVELVTKRTD